MELRREMRKIAFKSLSYSDHSLVILSKGLNFDFKPEGNYLMEMQICQISSNKQQILSLPVKVWCDNFNQLFLLSKDIVFIRLKNNIFCSPPVCPLHVLFYFSLFCINLRKMKEHGGLCMGYF